MDVNAPDLAEVAMLAEPAVSHRKAEVLCRHSTLAYLDRQPLDRALQGSGWTQWSDWDYDNNEGHLAWSDRCVLVAFRGTDSRSDWVQNSRAWWPKDHRIGGKIHRGFKAVADQAKQRVLDHLKPLAGGARRLLITGHSLGGALATDLAADLYASDSAWGDRIEVITFGAPRLGNADFEAAYESRASDRHWWYANSGDEVTHVPLHRWGYRHSGRLRWFDVSGELVEVDEIDVGLQSGEDENSPRQRVVRELIVEEQNRPEFLSEEAYAVYLEGLAEMSLDTPPAGLTANAEGEVTIAPPAGRLEGSGLGENHRLALYLERIRRVLNG